ncbi:hypothetical protein [Pelomonas sp. KK5]|uniref:hypothetical protein n=1 Tax=Pelomonas sp. KK5 TaxID=1855730 RepID=UPI0018E9C23C|nr:hypothetical protein [Pelomonas sp. KK5]
MAFLVWALLALSAVYWGLQLGARPLATPAHVLPLGGSQAARADLTRLLGATPVASADPGPAADSRYTLLGVVAPRAGRADGEGVALIAVDGTPRTVRIGAMLENELQLLSVDSRSASLGKDGVVSMTLKLAAPGSASTGTLAPAAPSPVNLGGMPAQPGPRGGTPFAQPPGGVQMPQPVPQQVVVPQGTPPPVDNQGNPVNPNS